MATQKQNRQYREWMSLYCHEINLFWKLDKLEKDCVEYIETKKQWIEAAKNTASAKEEYNGSQSY